MRIVRALSVGCLFAAGCRLLVGVDGLDSQTGLASQDAGGDAAQDASVVRDASTSETATSDAEVFDGGQCPGRPLPPGVPVGNLGYCIDRTHVTRAQYDQFLGSGPQLSSLPAAECGWLTTFLPSGNWPYTQAEANLPVTHVNWCQAWAYCSWAGKRLCGKIGGGSLASGESNDPTKSQWFAACSASGTRAYPYGNVFAANKCNTAELSAGGAVNAGSLAGCVGGVADLFDMSGQLHTLEDNCDAPTGTGTEKCVGRGGSFAHPANESRCDSLDSDARNAAVGDVGFRCCSG